jgi:hypothetical protein
LIIGLSGYKGCGKDTVAAYLVEKYAFERVAFADKLKEAVAALWDIERDFIDILKDYPNATVSINVDDHIVYKRSGRGYEPLTWREHLQRFGTEMGRNVLGTDIWVDLALPMMSKFHTQPRVVTDVRFENERERIREFGGYLVWIDRPGCESDGHISERNWLDDSEYEIMNDGTLDDLYQKVEDMLHAIV